MGISPPILERVRALEKTRKLSNLDDLGVMALKLREEEWILL